MFFKLSILAALVTPFVSALTVNQPSQAVFNGGDMTITWDTATGDPASFSIFLENPTFNSVFGVANNVDASLGTLTIQIPSVPPNEQYTIILVPINNVTDVLARSPPFNIGAVASTSTTAASSPGSISGAAATNTAASTTRPLATTTAFGTIVSNTSAATSSGSGSAASSAPPSSTSNSAALAVRFSMNSGVVASVVLSVFAGAAVVAL